jgi:hypothetical protein
MAVINHGLAVRQGLRSLRQQLPEILAKRTDVFSPRMIRIIEDLSSGWPSPLVQFIAVPATLMPYTCAARVQRRK